MQCKPAEFARHTAGAHYVHVGWRVCCSLQASACLCCGALCVCERSVLLAAFEGVPYLLLGLGDGQLFHWHLDTSTGTDACLKK